LRCVASARRRVVPPPLGGQIPPMGPPLGPRFTRPARFTRLYRHFRSCLNSPSFFSKSDGVLCLTSVSCGRALPVTFYRNLSPDLGFFECLEKLPTCIFGAPQVFFSIVFFLDGSTALFSFYPKCETSAARDLSCSPSASFFLCPTAVLPSGFAYFLTACRSFRFTPQCCDTSRTPAPFDSARSLELVKVRSPS